MSVIRELSVAFGLDVDAASFAKGALAAEAVKVGLELIVEAAKATVEFFVDVAKEAIEVASAFNDTSQAIGVTTDVLQELQYAGTLAHISADEMSRSITLLSKTMAKAKAGGEEQAKAFKDIGVKVKDATGHLRPAEDVIGDIADHFKAMPDGAEKTAKAVELFGRSGARMVSMLNEGSEGIALLRQEAHDLGLVMDADTIKLGDDVGDNIDRIKAIFTAIKVQAGAALFPILKQITGQIIDWLKANKELVRQKLAGVMLGIAKAAVVLYKIFDVLSGSIRAVADVLSGAYAMGSSVIKWLLDLGVAARAIAVIFGVLWVTALSVLIPWLAPVLAIGVGLATILLVLNSIQRFREGRDSLFGDWMKALAEWSKPNANDPWWLKAIKEAVVYLQQALGIAKKLGITVEDNSGGSDGNPVGGGVGNWARHPLPIDHVGDGEPGSFWNRFHQSRAVGRGVIDSLTDNNRYDSTVPSLPPGGGVTRAPLTQHNQNNFVINGAGLSPEGIADAITGRLEDSYDAAAAALE